MIKKSFKKKKLYVKPLDLPNNSSKKIKIICDRDMCGKILFVPYNNYINHNHEGLYYCKKCANRIYKSVDQHGRWNSKYTKEQRISKRLIAGYSNFKSNIMKRYTSCKKCNKTNGLEIHHLFSYNDYPEKLCDENNVVVLCKDCHSNFHSLYGKNTTYEDFNEWYYIRSELNRVNGLIPPTKPIYCLETEITYISASEAVKDLGGGSMSSICSMCNNSQLYKSYISVNGSTIKYKYKIKSVMGKHFIWYENLKELTNQDIATIINSKDDRHKRVKCVQNNKIYNSVKEASEDTKCTISKIWQSARKAYPQKGCLFYM